MAVQRRRNGDTVFIYEPSCHAKCVFLAGDFNQWEPTGHCMVKTKDGIFRAKLDLARGDYRYKFVVYGVWYTIPSSDQCQIPFGSIDSIVRTA